MTDDELMEAIGYSLRRAVDWAFTGMPRETAVRVELETLRPLIEAMHTSASAQAALGDFRHWYTQQVAGGDDDRPG